MRARLAHTGHLAWSPLLVAKYRQMHMRQNRCPHSDLSCGRDRGCGPCCHRWRVYLWTVTPKHAALLTLLCVVVVDAPRCRAVETAYPGQYTPPAGSVLLLCERGCGVEAPHIDDSIARRHCALSARVRAQRAEPAVGVPLVSVVAVQSGTRLLVWPGSHRVVAAMNGGRERPGPAASPIAPEVVQLSVGDVLLLRADVLHAGAACPDDANLHIRHTWTMVADVPAVDDTTTPGVKAEWPDTTADTRPVMTWPGARQCF